MTKLELTIGDTKVSWEVPYTDVTIKELLTGFAGLLWTHTFPVAGLVNNMKEFVEEHED